jgi:hypothetical protein
MAQATPPTNTSDFAKIELKTTHLFFAKFPLPEVKALCEKDTTSLDFFNALVKQQKHKEAITFLAHALPKKDAVSWAALCAKNQAALDAIPLAAPHNLAIQAAQKWVLAQSDETRRAAYDAAVVAPVGTPAGCAALAAFFSGGSLGPPTLAQPVPPPEDACAKAAAGSILMAGVFAKPEKAGEKYARFLADGLALASNRQP